MKVCAFQPQYPFTAAETDAYVQFLTKNVAESYSQTQQINTNLAELLG